MTPRLFFFFLIALGLTACESDAGSGSDQKPMNVLYIMADDLAYQAISAYGSDISKLAPTPNIDRIAQNGARMDAVYLSLIHI